MARTKSVVLSKDDKATVREQLKGAKGALKEAKSMVKDLEKQIAGYSKLLAPKAK